ncbi:MAG: nitroreductase family protein [Alistipes sp.]|nr:nitroreductase family protein [Alistipes sp.]
MELKKILDVRRSTRKFLEQPIEQQKLERVCQMALQAPSSRNSRSTRLMVVTDKEKLEALAKMRDYGSAFMKNATAAIIVMGDKQASDLWLTNCVISATILQLAIVDESLASCWVQIDGRPVLQAEPDGKLAEDYVRDLLDIPSKYGLLCAIALGYSDFQPASLPPYEGEERILWR